MSWVYQRRVKYYETDRMGVVHHSNYLRFLEDARMDWIRDHLMPYVQMEHMGIIVPTVSASGQFKHFLRYDDPFAVSVTLVQYSGVKLGFSYEIHNSDTGVLCYTGESEHYFSTGQEYRPISLKRKYPELHEKMLALLEAK